MKKTIIHIIPTLNNGGAETVLTKLSLAFHAKGMAQYIFTLHGNTKDFHYKTITTKIKVLDLNRDYKEIISILKAKNLVVIAWMYKSIVYAYWLNLLAKKNHLVYWNIRHSKFRPKQVFQKLALYIFGIATYVLKNKIIYCAHAAKKSHKKFLFKNNGSVVIHNRLAKVLNFESQEAPPPYLLYVGRHDPVKGPERLIAIVSALFKENKEVQLYIAGSHWKPKHIPNTIKERVSLLGNIKNLAPYYVSAKALLFTSYVEGYPNVLAEAISLGCPVVGFKAGDSEEILSNFKYGKTVYSTEAFLLQLKNTIALNLSERERKITSEKQKQQLNFHKTVLEYEAFLM